MSDGAGDLARLALDALRTDPALWPNDIAVTARRGVLTLTGWVDDDRKRRDAVARAHRVPGVRAVVDDIEVRLPDLLPRTDAEIAAAVLRALDLAAPGERLEVTVTDGWVTVGGPPAPAPRRLTTATLIARLSGVTGVTDTR